MTKDSDCFKDPVFGSEERLRRAIINAIVRFVGDNEVLHGVDNALLVTVLATNLLEPLWQILSRSDDDPEKFGRVIGTVAAQIARGEDLMHVA